MVVFLFAFLMGIVTVLLGIIVYLAYTKPEKGYFWLDFFWWFLVSLTVTAALVWLGIHMLKQRFLGNPLDVKADMDYPE